MSSGLDLGVATPRKPLGQLLREAGFVSAEQLEGALQEGGRTGERLGEVVVRRGWASEDDIAKLLAEQWQLGYVERSAIFFDVDALSRMTREQAQRLEALPTRVQDGRVVVAVAEPTEERLAALRQVIGADTVVVVVPKTALEAGVRSELLDPEEHEEHEVHKEQVHEVHEGRCTRSSSSHSRRSRHRPSCRSRQPLQCARVCTQISQRCCGASWRRRRRRMRCSSGSSTSLGASSASRSGSRASRLASAPAADGAGSQVGR